MRSNLRQICLVLLFLIVQAYASIYPDGEDKETWDARINAKIDQIHKRDVTISITLTPDELTRNQAGNLRLRVNQSRNAFPFGKIKNKV